jgi:hypothetical protein
MSVVKFKTLHLISGQHCYIDSSVFILIEINFVQIEGFAKKLFLGSDLKGKNMKEEPARKIKFGRRKQFQNIYLTGKTDFALFLFLFLGNTQKKTRLLNVSSNFKKHFCPF